MQRARIECMHSRWKGGILIQLGCADPAAIVEMVRRGARAMVVDGSAERLQSALDTAAAAGATGLFHSLQTVKTCLEAPSAEVESRLGGERADVAFVEELPAGAAWTPFLEWASRIARCLCLPISLKNAIPDRFLQFASAAPGESHFYIEFDSDEGAPRPFAVQTRITGTSENPGEACSQVQFERTLQKAATPGDHPVLAVVRDGGHPSSGPDASAHVALMPDRACSAVATSTRTDRFSREHVSCLRTFDEVWVPGPFALAAATASGIERGLLRVVRETVDLDEFMPAPRLVGGFRVLAMASNAARIEEAATAAAAFVNSLGNEPDATLTILCGPGVPCAAVEAAIVQILGAARPNSIHIAGPVARAEMPAFYRQFDLFLRPSRGERRATAILEAMACGVPVAATRFGLAAEIVHLTNGYPIEPRGFEVSDPSLPGVPASEAGHRRPIPSIESACEALRAAFDDWEGRMSRASEARQHIVKYHHPQNVAEQIRQLPWSQAAASPEPASALPSPVSEETVAEAAAALAPDVFFDASGAPAPRAHQLDAAAGARELWCSTRLAAQGWSAAGFPARHIHFVPPVVNTNIFHPKARPSALPTRRRFRILADARNDYYSGADLALRAFAHANLQQAALVVLGARPEVKSSLAKLAASFKNEVEVVFIQDPGSENGRASILAACDLVIDAARCGSDGSFVLEAAACGRPAIAPQHSIPPELIGSRTGYPAPAAIVVGPGTHDDFITPPFFCEIHCELTGELIQLAATDAAGRMRRASAARTMALEYSPAHLAAWIAQRRAALSVPDPQEVTLAFVAPRGTARPPLPSDTEYYELHGNPERGGLADETNEILSTCTADFVILCSGSFTTPANRRPDFAQQLVEPLAASDDAAMCFAKGEHGAIAAVRPSLLRSVTFPAGFRTGAMIVEFARSVAAQGLRVIPLPQLNIEFLPSAPGYCIEAQCVELFEEATRHLQEGKTEVALELLNLVSERHPSYVAARSFGVDLLVAIGDLDEAIASQHSNAMLTPRDPAGFARAGMLCSKAGRHSEAARFLRTAHELAPQDLAVATMYGGALLSSGDHTAAAEVLLRTLEQHPESAESALLAAESLQHLGRESEAQSLLQTYEIVAAPAPAPPVLATTP
jgi:glycosyltransferase involved in cell wall biosynthesis/thioredoxin-like negative regulator of GroEL